MKRRTENNKKSAEKSAVGAAENRNPVIEAYFNLPAFLTIVTSAVEVFKKETIGYLIGFKGENKFVVEHAIPYQTAESGFAHATIDLKKAEKVDAILKKLSEGLEYIGDFHSHTVFGESPARVVPSRDDLATSVIGELNVIVAVNTNRRSVKWREDNRGVLVGTVGDYRIEIGAYYVAKLAIGRKYQRVRVRCPSITGLGVLKK